MNNPNEQATTSAALALVDPERRALEARINLAKRALMQDLNRVSALVKRTAGTAGRSLTRVVALGLGLMAVGLLAVFIRRHRRLRYTWK